MYLYCTNEIKVYTKFELAVKKVKVTQGSSFEQTLMDNSAQCIPSFVETGPLVPEKKIFEGFYDIWALRSSCLCDQHHIKQIFISVYLLRKS